MFSSTRPLSSRRPSVTTSDPQLAIGDIAEAPADEAGDASTRTGRSAAAVEQQHPLAVRSSSHARQVRSLAPALGSREFALLPMHRRESIAASQARLVPLLYAEHRNAHLNLWQSVLGTNWQTVGTSLIPVLRAGASAATDGLSGVALSRAAGDIAGWLAPATGSQPIDQNVLTGWIGDALVFLDSALARQSPAMLSPSIAFGLSALVTFAEKQGFALKNLAFGAVLGTRVIGKVNELRKLVQETTSVKLVRTVRDELLRVNAPAIQAMEPELRDSFNAYKDALRLHLVRPDSHEFNEAEARTCHNHLSWMEFQIAQVRKVGAGSGQRLQSAQARPTTTLQVAEEIDRICQNVDAIGGPVLAKFLRDALRKKHPGWKPVAHDSGLTDVTLLVLMGGPGGGKTRLAKLIADVLVLPSVLARFDDANRFIGGDANMTVDQRNAWIRDGQSPRERYGSFHDVAIAPDGALVVMNEPDMKGDGSEAFVNGVNLTWDPNSWKDEVRIAGSVPGTVDIVRPKRMSYLMTRNDELGADAFHRRFKTIRVKDMIEPDFRQIAADSRDTYVRHYLLDPMQYDGHVFTPSQILAIKDDVADQMNDIVKKGMQDAGPSNMLSVMADFFDHVASLYVQGKRVAPEAEPGAVSLLDQVHDTAYGIEWPMSPTLPAEPSAEQAGRARRIVEDRSTVERFYASYRGPDVVGHLMLKARELRDRPDRVELPTHADYKAIADKDTKLKPNDALKFVSEALMEQWRPVLQHKDAQMRKTIEHLNTRALQQMVAISETDGARESMGNADAHLKLETLDRIMRLPTVPLNISHWQQGGTPQDRARTQAAVTAIVDRFGGPSDAAGLLKFLWTAVDNSMPRPSSMEQTRPRALLLLSGPARADAVGDARRMISGLGLRPVNMDVERYNHLFDAARRDEPNQGGKSMSFGQMVAEFGPLVEGRFLDCAIVVSNVDPRHGEQIDRLIANARPDVTDPSLTVFGSPEARVKIRMKAVPAIFVLRDEHGTDPRLEALMPKHRIGRIGQTDLRADVEQAFIDELKLLWAFDYPLDRKEAIRDAVRQVLPRALQVAVERDFEPRVLHDAIASLFSQMRVGLQTELMAGSGGPSATGSSASLGDVAPIDWSGTETLPDDHGLLERLVDAMARERTGDAVDDGAAPAAGAITRPRSASSASDAS